MQIDTWKMLSYKPSDSQIEKMNFKDREANILSVRKVAAERTNLTF